MTIAPEYFLAMEKVGTKTSSFDARGVFYNSPGLSHKLQCHAGWKQAAADGIGSPNICARYEATVLVATSQEIAVLRKWGASE